MLDKQRQSGTELVENRCRMRACCAPKRPLRASGVPVCATLCLCLLCSLDAHGQSGGTSPTTRNGPAPASPVGNPPKVFLPRVVRSVDAVYPSGSLAEHQEARVQLYVTVLANGEVGRVEVESSGGQAFDDSAIAAIRQWRFLPARRGTQPIDSRISVPFQFQLPQVATSPSPPSASEPATADPAVGESADTDPALVVTVRGRKNARTERRSASDFQIDRTILAAAPRKEGAEVLRAAPGVYIGRAEGPAVAHNYMLRGFDAEHGQDIEFRVGGVPINLPSHIHGQGYADLGFLIGDTVRELQVSEGVYDPRQGDFAVAGSIDVALGVEERERGVRLQSGYSSWGTFRQLALWAPPNETDENFGAVQYMETDGFGDNRAGTTASGIFQNRFGDGDVTIRSIGVVHAARARLAGVVRQDDVEAGNVCFTCTYNYPSAQAQNALANRFLAGLFADFSDPTGANGQAGVWVSYDNFRVQENFTGFIQESRELERVAGRGDLIEQQNRTISFGLTGRRRTEPFRLAPWASGTVEVGADGRVDVIDQSQRLLDASVRNQVWDRRVQASVLGVDLGLWGDLDWTLSEFVHVRAGLRADVLSYDVDDRLGNFAPLTRPQDSFIPGFRRSALGATWGPRTSIEVHPFEWMSMLAAYGEGYRSPQARLLEDGESAPFSKVRSGDVGFRFNWGPALHLTVGGYYTHLSDDIAFDAAEALLQRIGATQRLGAVAYGVTRPFEWLVGSLSVTYVDATLLEPPPASAEEPQPPFTEGQRLPFVPPVVVRADLGARQTLVESLGGQPMGVRAGLGLSYLSPRPLPYGGSAHPVGLLDISTAVTWGPVDLELKLFNAQNTRYAAVEYSFPSDWNPDNGVRPRTPARHTAAGAPMSWQLSLGLTL